MVKIVVVLATLLIISCNIWNSDSNNRAQNIMSSTCGGFSKLAKTLSLSWYNKDSTNYCEAEKIQWYFDSTTHVTRFLHSRNLQNCGAKLDVFVQQTGSIFSINETNSSKDLEKCDCYFDTYWEIATPPDTISFRFENQDYTISKAVGAGIIVIDTTQSWPCN